MRDSLKLWRSYIEAARHIPDADRLAYYDALFDYGFDGIEPELDGIPAAMFILTKPNLDKSITKADAGSAGGTSKPQANGKQTTSKPQAIREERIENREERIENIPPLPPTRGNSEAAHELPDVDFEAFWDLYPNKKSKGEAKKAWKQLNPSGEIVSAIMAKLPLLIASPAWTKEGGAYIPKPATWLRAEGWEDVPIANVPIGKPVNTPTPPEQIRKNAEWMRQMLESG